MGGWTTQWYDACCYSISISIEQQHRQWGLLFYMISTIFLLLEKATATKPTNALRRVTSPFTCRCFGTSTQLLLDPSHSVTQSRGLSARPLPMTSPEPLQREPQYETLTEYDKPYVRTVIPGPRTQRLRDALGKMQVWWYLDPVTIFTSVFENTVTLFGWHVTAFYDQSGVKIDR